MPQIEVSVARVPGYPTSPGLPQYATPGSAGMDIRAAEAVTIEPGCFAAVATGLVFSLPPGYEMQVRPRSGLAIKHGITVLNAPGTVDEDYAGEVKVLLINHGKSPFEVDIGDRIAQVVFAPVTRATLSEIPINEVVETSRGGGFGSTGLT